MLLIKKREFWEGEGKTKLSGRGGAMGIISMKDLRFLYL